MLSVLLVVGTTRMKDEAALFKVYEIIAHWINLDDQLNIKVYSKSVKE